MGSGYLLGSGTSRFRDPQVLGARKVPGTLGFRQGSGNLTMVSSGSGITGTPILKHPGNPEFGERGFRQGSSNTGFRQGSENHRGCGPTVWIYFLDYATGSGQGQGCGTTIFKKPSPGSREPGFWQGSEVPETTQGSDIRRGLYQGSCYGQGPRKPIFKETKVPGPYRPCQRAIADRGGAQRDNKSARLGSANPGFQYTLWVVPRFRKRGFQEDKVPGTQGIPEIPQPILGALWRVPHMPIHVRLLSGRTASVD